MMKRRKKMTKLLIIDGNNLAHRARHAFIKFSNEAGQSSSIAYGGPFIISSLLRKFPSDICYVPFDMGRAKERMGIWPGYKDREKTLDYDADNFHQQMDDFITILLNLNVRVVRGPGQEADDFIYALTRKFKKLHKTIVSSDKDFVPLVGGYTKIFNPFKDKIISSHNCKTVYGFEANEFLDYLILKGDKSDGIPGVSGLGDKRIRQFLDTYGSIDDFMELFYNGEELGTWEKYAEDIEDIHDRNNLLINLRYFHNKFRKKATIPIEMPVYDPDKVKAIARKYRIRTFHEDKFLKPFKKLGE